MRALAGYMGQRKREKQLCARAHAGAGGCAWRSETIWISHSSHGVDEVPECKGEEKVRLGELATKDGEPE